MPTPAAFNSISVDLVIQLGFEPFPYADEDIEPNYYRKELGDNRFIAYYPSTNTFYISGDKDPQFYGVRYEATTEDELCLIYFVLTGKTLTPVAERVITGLSIKFKKAGMRKEWANL